MDGNVAKLDRTLLLALRVKKSPSDSPSSQRAAEIARDITALGSFTILAFASTVWIGVMIAAKQRKTRDHRYSLHMQQSDGDELYQTHL